MNNFLLNQRQSESESEYLVQKLHGGCSTDEPLPAAAASREAAWTFPLPRGPASSVKLAS